MTAMTPDQLRTLLRYAGFKKDSQTENDMVGIAYAESGGDPTKHNTTPPDDSYGIWQINMYKDLGPGRRKQFGISSDAQLLDPQTNAKAAYVVYKNQGLDAWTTYKNGEYLKHMDGMTTAEGGNKTPAATVTDAYSGLSGTIRNLGENVFKISENFMGIGIALVLLVLGVVILVMQTDKGKALVKTGVKAAVL